ncbi:aspartate aminotransferase family protein [Aminobacter anthyllidis]|uniref:Aspartate aminotransferase family protein n=1 Tax=Aminobacter anthyllidis TaxID=1035067 RepID=A0A9X1AFI1_9HYPH|nr:aminotransferase class V-fold PLP-dependent enzyme [Aminobacter anthyllidis]MBT1158621.1 aspartate aminotransferase family protein [Aminobacter anthyllidis]
MSNIEHKRRGLPKKGIEWSTLRVELEELKGGDFKWREGRVPSYTYFFNDETLRVQKEAYCEFMSENGLGAGRAFPSLSRMIDDIFAIGLELFNAPDGSGASFTSGGTESVFQAVKTARDQARAMREEKFGYYNVVTPLTAHPCLSKVAEILDVTVKRVDLDAERRGDLAALEQAIDEHTIMLYGSAPCYPYGVFDPIADMGRLAQKRQLWLHVDACWGGFISPFAKKLGYPIPEWDFNVPGVTSLSADIHKFGYGAKGASLVLYRDAQVQKYERFEFSDWPRGTYVTPTFMGTKPGGAIAAAWAVMQYLGEEGYLQATRETMDATMRLVQGINKIPGLVCLEPTGEANLVTFVATDPAIDIMAVADRLEKRGWFRGRMREPLGIHQGVNPAHLPVVDDYLSEVSAAVNFVTSRRLSAKYDEHSY